MIGSTLKRHGVGLGIGLMLGSGLVIGIASSQLLNAVTPAPSQAAISDGMSALDVLGQPNFTSGSPDGGVGVGPTGFNQPQDVVVDEVGHRLFATDNINNRVLVFNLTAGNILTDKTADFVLGQPDFVSNAQATTQSGMRRPNYLEYDAVHNRLFVSDFGSARVLVYDLTGGVTNGMGATWVVGQPNFTSGTGFESQTRLSQPYGVAYDPDNDRLFVSDSRAGGPGGNHPHRVVVWDLSGGITNGMAAANVLGHATFGGSIPQPPSQSIVVEPQDLAYDRVHQRLFVSDYLSGFANTNRVMVFDVASITNGENAVSVLGAPTFTSATPGLTQSRMNGPRGLAYDAVGQRLFVSEYINHRVMVYDVAAIVNGQPASNVIGQASFTTNAFATTQTSLNGPIGMAYDSSTKRLYATSIGNHRIMIFDVSSGLTATCQGAGACVSTTNPDGSTTVTIVQSGSTNIYTVTLPAGTTAADISVSGNTNHPQIMINAAMPSGSTKTVVLPSGNGTNVCIRDRQGAEFGGTSCQGSDKFNVPAAGACATYSVDGDPTDVPVAHNVNVCLDAAGAVVTVSGLTHSALETFTDADDDGWFDDTEACPDAAGTHDGCPSAAQMTFERHRVGRDESKDPISEAVIKAFAKDDACVASIGSNPHDFETVYTTCQTRFSGVTDTDGVATFGIAPSDNYLVIGQDPQSGVYDGATSGTVSAGDVIQKTLQAIVNGQGEQVNDKTKTK